MHGPAVEVQGLFTLPLVRGPRGPRGDAPALLRLSSSRTTLCTPDRALRASPGSHDGRLKGRSATRSPSSVGAWSRLRQFGVVRADKGAVLVLPAGRFAPGCPTRTLSPSASASTATVSSRARTATGLPTVGDWLDIDDDHAVLLHERRTALVRDTAGGPVRVQALAANIDVVLIVEHLDPDPDLGRIERMLTLAWRSGATPVVVLTKADLVPRPGRHDRGGRSGGARGGRPHGQRRGPARALDAWALLRPGATARGRARRARQVDAVNALAGPGRHGDGRPPRDGRGRHTTTHRELVPLPGGAMLIDTPGIRGVGVVADADALDTTFADVAALAAVCRFADCHHAGDAGCAIAAALESGELAVAASTAGVGWPRRPPTRRAARTPDSPPRSTTARSASRRSTSEACAARVAHAPEPHASRPSRRRSSRRDPGGRGLRTGGTC